MKISSLQLPKVKTEFIVIVFAMLVGAWIRLNYLVKSDFPLNDGGLFYSMARDLIENGFRVPQFTSYNQSQIPFAYPFLPMYLIAFLDQFSSIRLLDSLHYLPFAFNILTIPFVYFLIKKLTASERVSGLALLVYVLIRPSYEWFIFGGGITRAMSWFFAIIALNIYLDSIFDLKKYHFFFLPIFIALTFACHLEIGYFVVFSLLIFYVYYSRRLKGLAFIFIIGISSIILLAPYWVTVIGYHGFDIFLTALSAGEYRIDLPIAKIIYFNFTFEGLLPVFAVFSLLGFITCFLTKRWLLPIWIIAILILDPRSIDRSVAIPISTLASIAYFEIILPGFQKLYNESKDRKSAVTIDAILHSFFILYIFFAALFQGFVAMPQMKGLSAEHRDVMKQISVSFPTSSKFLVVSTTDNWPIDLVGEWFPALAQRQSVKTVQGSEWLTGGTYYKMISDYDELMACIKKNATCFQEWFSVNHTNFDYVYFSKDLIDKQKIQILDLFGNLQPVIENTQVLVYQSK